MCIVCVVCGEERDDKGVQCQALAGGFKPETVIYENPRINEAQEDSGFESRSICHSQGRPVSFEVRLVAVGVVQLKRQENMG